MSAPELTLLGEPLERSQERLNLKLLDPHEARALELDDLGESRRAQLVLLCSAKGTGFPMRTCKQRVCPTCSKNIALRNSRMALARIERMKSKRLYLVTICSHLLNDLAQAITAFKIAFRRLRDRTCFANVRAGVGAVEPKLSDDQLRWVVHAHLVLDVDPAQLDVSRVHIQWTKLLYSWSGKFSAQDDPRVRSAHAIAKYITKAWDWSPAPGAMELQRLGLLFNAVRGRRLVIAWGPQTTMSQAEASQ